MEETTDKQNDAQEMDINADADIPGNTHMSNPGAENEHDKLYTELKEQKDKYLRLVAEFDNYKRRSARERMEMNLTAGKEIIVALLEVLDDCDRAEKLMNNQADNAHVLEGVKLVFSKLRNTMQQKGLKKMESMHEEFDVEKHDAITEIEVGENLKGKVVDVLETGYALNDKMIRFAKVVVGK